MKTMIQKNLPSMTDGRTNSPFFLKGENGYEASLGAYRAVVAKPETGAAVTLTGDGINVGWRWLGEKKPKRLTICGSSAIYEGILPDVDLEYRVSNGGIKENVILKKSVECDRFAFSLFTGGLSVHEDADGSLSLCDGDTVRLTVPAPFMFDAKGAHSDAVRYDLVPEGDGYRLTLCPDPKWLSDPARVFPITVDPQMVVPVLGKGFGTWVTQDADNINSEIWGTPPFDGYLRVYRGTNLFYRSVITLTKNKLPALIRERASNVKLCLIPTDTSIGSSLTVNGNSAYLKNNNTLFEYDLTDLLKNASDKVELILQPEDYESPPPTDIAFELSGDRAPYFLVEYVTNEYDRPVQLPIPLVDEVGAVLDIGSGKLTTEIEDISESGTILGCGISHIYNPGAENGYCGKGFRLNFDEKLEKNTDDSLNADYLYTDANGDQHGFKKSFYYITNGTKKYTEESKVRFEDDGTMTLLTNQNVPVYKEYRSQSGWTVLSVLEDEDTLSLVEHRSQERVQLEEQLKSCKNALQDYERINMVTGDLVNAFRYCELSQRGYDNFLSSMSGAHMILPRAEAANYKGVLIQKEQLPRQKERTQAKKSEYEEAILLINSEIKSIETELEKMRETPSAYENEIETSQILLQKKFAARDILVSEKARLEADLVSCDKSLSQVTEQGHTITGKRDFYFDQFEVLMTTYLKCKVRLQEMKKGEPLQYLKKDKIIKGFNEDGDLVMLADINENYLFIQRDERNRIEFLYDNEDREILFTYQIDGTLGSITDTHGRKTEYTYSSADYLTQIKYFNGVNLDFSYGNENITSIQRTEQEKADKKATLTYVAERFLTATVVSELKEVRHEGTVQDESAVKAVLSSHSLAYDENSHAVLTDEDGNREIYTLNYNTEKAAYGLDEYHVEHGGTVSKAERYTYVPYEKDETVFAKKSTLNSTPFEFFVFVPENCSKTQLNSFNLPKSKETTVKKFVEQSSGGIVCEKTVEAYEYDEAFRHPIRITTTVGHFLGNNQVGDSLCFVTVNRYDAKGNRIYTESYVEGEELTTGKTVEETFYDEKGNVKKSYTYNTLDSASKFYTEAEYGKHGEVLSEPDATGRFKTEYAYVEGTTLPQTTKLPNGSEFSYGYDASDNVTSVTQSTEEGEENSTRTLTTLGLVTEVNSANHTVNYEYDEKRRQTAVKLDGADYVSYAHEEIKENGVKLGEKLTTALAGGTTVLQKNDAHGNPLCVLVNGEERMRATYNERNQVASLTDVKRGETASFTYDADTGKRTSATRLATGGTSVLSEGGYLRNTYGKLTAKTLTLGSDAQTYTFAYKNTAGRDLDFTAVKGLKFKVKTDKSERNAGKVVYSTDGTEKQILEESISYLKYGDHATMLPEKITHRYAGQMGLRHSNTRRYAYDGMGNITHIYEDGVLAAQYTYDSLNRLVREDAVGFGTRIYTYDACGNILSRRQLGLTMEDAEKISPFIGTTVYYEYDGDRMTSYDGAPCVYDAIGNLTTYRSYTENNITWTDGRRLASFNGVTFTYDGMGRRMTKGNTTYTYDFDGRLLRQSDGTRTLTFLYDHTGLAAVDYTNTSDSSVGGVYAYVKDIQGNIISLVDKDGNPVVKYTYDAWGNQIIRDSIGEEFVNDQNIALINPFRYRGYYYDTETGLYYLKTRYYDPEVGRFLNADDVSFLDPDTVNGLNLYAYCANNPVMNVDPTGNFPVLAVVLGIIALAGLVLTIGGVASDNNVMTAIGLTMVTVPALISGGIAIAAGFAGATLTGIIGGITALAGIGTGLFASAEYQEAFTGNNWMLDAGMSEGRYNGLMIATAAIATAGTFASSSFSAFNIKWIKQFGRFGKYGQKGYRGMKFTTGTRKTQVLSFHTHSHVDGKNLSQWHWQLQKWNPKAGEVSGTVRQWLWWNLRRM